MQLFLYNMMKKLCAKALQDMEFTIWFCISFLLAFIILFDMDCSGSHFTEPDFDLDQGVTFVHVPVRKTSSNLGNSLRPTNWKWTSTSLSNSAAWTAFHWRSELYFFWCQKEFAPRWINTEKWGECSLLSPRLLLLVPACLHPHCSFPYSKDST